MTLRINIQFLKTLIPKHLNTVKNYPSVPPNCATPKLLNNETQISFVIINKFLESNSVSNLFTRYVTKKCIIRRKCLCGHHYEKAMNLGSCF